LLPRPPFATITARSMSASVTRARCVLDIAHGFKRGDHFFRFFSGLPLPRAKFSQRYCVVCHRGRIASAMLSAIFLKRFPSPFAFFPFRYCDPRTED
jgi:hypothetical protein